MNLKRIFASVVIAAVASMGVTVASSTSASAGVSLVNTKPCKSEESTNPCFWDAQKRGNKLGTSFYVLPKNSKGVIQRANGTKRVVSLVKGTVAYDPAKSTADGYVRYSTNGSGWVLVCPKGWTVERLNSYAVACN